MQTKPSQRSLSLHVFHWRNVERCVLVSGRIRIFGSETQRPSFLPIEIIGRLQAVCKYTDKYSIANSEAPGCTENSGTQMLALLPRYDQEFSSQAPLYAALACLRLHSIFGVILFLLGSHGRRFAMTPPTGALSPPQAGILGPVHVSWSELGAVLPNVCH